jgi:small subunit ribosomal protein S7
MRRSAAKPRKIEPDPIFRNRLVTKLINRAMYDGKKSVIQREVYEAFELIRGKGEDPMQVFSLAMENVKPQMEVRARRIGGAAYQVPQPVRGVRKEALAIRWIVASSRARSNSEFHTYAEKLATELLEAAKNEGGAVRKKQDMEKTADANRAFSHFRW